MRIRHALFILPAIAGLLLTPSREAEAQTPDFLFGSPRGTIGVRTGWRFARADSELFSFVENQLTLDRNDFNAPAIGVDFDLAVTPRLSAVFGFDYAGSSAESQFRGFLDNQELPIQQRTRLREMNLGGSIKVALTPRGRAISSRAWIPSSITPYVGAGLGALWYKFDQEGDFVDFDDFDVFPHIYASRGWTPSAHLFGGVDVQAWRKVYFTGEARYLWSHATLNEDFVGFDPLDLSGLKLTAGLRYMF